LRYETHELGVGGILDQAIAVTKDHFWLLFKIVIVMLLPFTIVAGWLIAEDVLAAQAGQGLSMRFGILSLVNMAVVYPLTNAAMIYAVASSYLSRPVSVATAFRRAVSVFLPLLWTMFLLWLVLTAGMILLIVPFFIFLLWYALIVQVVVLEGLSGRAALKRSHQLMKGNAGTAIVLGILVLVISWALNFMQSVIPVGVLRLIVYSVIQSLLFIFGAAAWVVFYFSCRAKAEHFDLALLADAVGVEDDQPPDALNVSPGEVR
jgi:hypothetical protein